VAEALGALAPHEVVETTWFAPGVRQDDAGRLQGCAAWRQHRWLAHAGSADCSGFGDTHYDAPRLIGRPARARSSHEEFGLALLVTLAILPPQGVGCACRPRKGPWPDPIEQVETRPSDSLPLRTFSRRVD